MGQTELRIDGVLGSSVLPWCSRAHTSPSYRSMLPLFRGQLRLREGAGQLPALPFRPGTATQEKCAEPVPLLGRDVSRTRRRSEHGRSG